MSEDNPYSSPGAALDGRHEGFYQPRFFSLSGRIGRMRYLAYSAGIFVLSITGAGVVVAVAMGLATFTDTVEEEWIRPGYLEAFLFFSISIIMSFVVIIMWIVFAKRRLNDLNRSGWWFLLICIPVVNLLLWIYMLLVPGTKNDNDFGPAPVANSLSVLMLGWAVVVLLLGFVMRSIILAIAGP